MSIKILVNLAPLLNAILVLVIMSCSTIWSAQGVIIISKRAKLSSDSKENYFCLITDKESESGSYTTSLKINCSQVPAPIIKLEVDGSRYFRANSGHFIAPGEYCVLEGNSKYGKLCPLHSDPLWRKCCEENEILDATSFKCRRSRIKYRPNLGNTVFQSFVVTKNNITVTEGKSFRARLNCTNSSFVPKLYSSNPCLPESNGIFQLAANGTPMYETSTGVFLRKMQLKAVEHDSYCIDGILDFSSSTCATFESNNEHHANGNEYEGGFGDNIEVGCRRAEMEEVLLLCVEEQETFLNEDGDADIPKTHVFAALWLSTCPLLLSSALVNSCLIQKNVHGWILTSYLISMFLVNINSVVLILDLHVPAAFAASDSEGGCGVLDFTMKFIYLSSLCWMSSMCMNMLRTFSSRLPQVAIEPHRFLLSALFSLGFPIIAVLVSYYVGSLPDDESLLQVLRNVESNTTTSYASPLQTCRKGTCALYSYKTLPYYSGPIIFLVCCNVVAFLKTSSTIASLRRQAEAVLHKQTRDHLESFALFAKLFLLTGSIWVIRVALLVLQIQGSYVTWYGVALEAVFSIPEVVFPIIIFHHPEFIKWASRKSPMISRAIVKCSPFCRKELVFKDRTNSPKFQSANQISSVDHQYNHLNQKHSRPTGDNDQAALPHTTTTSTGFAVTAQTMQATSTTTV